MPRLFPFWGITMPESTRPISRDSIVSVALASCNGERWIAEQIGSILAQLGPNDEVVVADASSTDGTLSIVASFADPRIRILRDLPRGDIPGTFEHALRACRGEYLFLSDQDDVWLPGKVEQCLESLASSGAELLLHDARIVDTEGREITSSFLEWNGFSPGFLSNLWRPGYMGCALCFRRSLLERALPFPPRIPMHDWWLGLLAELGHGVFVLRRPYILHRLHGANATFQPRTSRHTLSQRLRMRVLILSQILRRTGLPKGSRESQ